MSFFLGCLRRSVTYLLLCVKSVVNNNWKVGIMAAAILDQRKKSIFTYHRVLLFNYDVQCRTPFNSYNRNMFSEEDIPKCWFTGPLTPANRKKVLSLGPLGGGRFSVFGKIEIGMLNYVELSARPDILVKNRYSLFKCPTELLDISVIFKEFR